MPTFMLKVDGVLRRRRWLVLGVWVALLLCALPLAMRQSDHLRGGGFDVPGSSSKAVADATGRNFPGVESTQLGAVLVPQRGARPDQLRAAVERLGRAAGPVGGVAVTPAARAAADRAAEAGRPFVVPLRITVPEDSSSDVAKHLRDRLRIDAGPRDGVATHLIGQGALWAGLQEVSKTDLAKAESIGFPIVLLILVAVFGSFAAAALPLALGGVSVLVTGAAIYLLSRSVDMSVFVTNMASMIGIGVAVDYSLFILARYREEIQAGADRAAARATAMATSGTAVAFSGLTVIVSLAGLWMIDNQALRSMALGAMLVVAVSVVASATLLPVLIALFGHRAYARNRVFTITGLLVRSRAPRRPGSTRPDVERLGFWRRWTNAIMRRPIVAVVATSSLLLVLAAPVLSLHTSTGALAQFPKGNETRVGFEAASALGGRGASSPVGVLVRFHRGTATAPDNRAAVDAVRLRLAGDPQVVRVAGVRTARDGRAALVTAIPRREAEAAATKDLVARLRHDLPRTAPAAATAVGGSAARQYDVQNMISGSMWKIILFVLGLSYVVLLILLRSVVLPLKAVLMNLLSVGAAYGVLVVVFQWGWLDGLLGFQHLGHLDVLTPPLVLAVVFGLSMDYEVFLLSRIRERWEATGDSRQAVAEGLAASARTITSAALIMASVFLVFTFTGVPSIKELGLGNAVAILIDATIVRLILVPATMELLGDWNWWLPKPLARILPRRSFERRPEPAPAN